MSFMTARRTDPGARLAKGRLVDTVRTIGRVGLFAAVLAIAAGLGGAAWVVYHGVSARAEPTAVERVIARAMRHVAVPRADRDRPNPSPATPATLQAGLEHFADHCAACHANNGSGDTAMGRGLYPKAPDMRLPATQGLSDGELFWIIENGVRLTGMPAWSTGTPDGEAASWQLVQFIRHLPRLTDAEREQMDALNPRSPQEIREEDEMRRFLEGGDTPAAKTPAASTPHGGHDDDD